jgi:hypothetical protein
MGYAAEMDTECSGCPPALSQDLLAAPLKSVFARMRVSNTAEALPVFVTMDTAEIVVQEDGKRQLLYRGRGNATVRKIKGVFVAVERVESVVHSIVPFHFVMTAAGRMCECCASTSVARACFVGDALFCVVAFDFCVELLGSAAQMLKDPPRFNRRDTLNEFLCSAVQGALKLQVLPESVPTLQNIAVYCTNVWFSAAQSDSIVASWADVLPSRVPLLASGKLNFMAACNVCHNETEPSASAVGSELAAAIASCAGHALSRNCPISLDANFFDVGGDSLTGTKLLVAVQALAMHCHRQIPFDMLLQNPSANTLAAALSSSLDCLKFPVHQPSISHRHGVRSDVPLPEQPKFCAVSTSQMYSHFSAEDQRDTRIIEWLPNASVRLWRQLGQHWLCRIRCMAKVIFPGTGGSQQCNPLERVRWKIDMGACVDASPLVFALRTCEFGHTCRVPENEFPLLPGFSVLAIVGSHTGLVVAAEVATGHVVWSVTLPDRIEPGRSSAVLHPDSASVLMGCYDGFLYALCICKGAIKWKFDTNDSTLISRAAPSQRDPSSAKRPKIGGKEDFI